MIWSCKLTVASADAIHAVLGTLLQHSPRLARARPRDAVPTGPLFKILPLPLWARQPCARRGAGRVPMILKYNL